MNVPSVFIKRALQHTPDMRRIEALPRRAAFDQGIAGELTSALRTPAGTMSLRPIQVQALYELGTYGGMFGPIRVGGGKTLISLLAPYVLDAKRPVLLLPAALIDKTERAMRELSAHWRIPRNLRILSYEGLGRIQAAETLQFYKPDLVIADEAHRLKNKKAGVTRRVVRYMREHPDTKFVAISGTMMRKSLREFAHLLRWSHKDNAPIPEHEGETEEWANALDETVNPLTRVAPGPLLEWPGAEGTSTLERARRAFHRRLVDTPAVVSTSGEQVACSLYIRGRTYDVEPATEANFQRLRSMWETPDGWALSEAVAIWRHARELALGFHYVWDPRPPEEWLEARRAWAKFVRETLAHSRTLDTELQVANACTKGQLRDIEYRAWRAIKDTFTINSKAVWHDSSALELCEAWMKEGPGIVWCDHVFFAEELARRTGAPYYGANGQDRRGNPIPEFPAGGKDAVICSISANATGRNLQRWNRNLITSMPGAQKAEQLLGRTHRDGQDADQVEAEILVGCFEHFDAWEKALADAAYARDALGESQKILDADVTFPTRGELARIGGARFAKTELASLD